MTTVEVPLSQGYIAIVDAADAPRVLAHKWHAQPSRHTVYARRNVRQADGRRTTQSLHKFLTEYEQTDHRNGNGLDNRRLNLREATAGENNRNGRLRSDNTSGFRGVQWRKSERNWHAQIYRDGKRKHVGFYATAEAAARAYDAAAREIHGEFACLNFPAPGERAA